MNPMNTVGAQTRPSFISTIRARRAQKAIDARQASFTMNEFGDVGIVDYATLKKVGELEQQDVTNLLQGREVKVRPTETRQRDPKPHAINLNWWQNLRSAVAKFFNARTTGRANRIQDEIELQFGLVAGRMVNVAIHQEGGDFTLAADMHRQMVTEISSFIHQIKDFAQLYALDVTQPTATEDLIHTFVTRFVNSIKEDEGAVRRLYTVAQQWQRQEVPTQHDEVMRTLREALQPLVGEVDVEGAAPVEEKPVAKPQKAPLTEQVAQEKAFLKESLSNQLKLVRELCSQVGTDMDIFKEAFFQVGCQLDSLDDLKNLSGGNFRAVVKDMDAMVQEVISKGRLIIEKAHEQKRAEEVLVELEKGYGDISHINFEQTNEMVSNLLESNWSTADKVKSKLGFDFVEIDSLDDEAFFSPETKWKRLDSSASVSTTNHLNDVIQKFAAARETLTSSIRDRVERYALMEVLAKKGQTPPNEVDAKLWQEAWQLVGDYLVNGGSETPEELTNAHVALLMKHAAAVANDLPITAKERLDTIFNAFEVSKGFVNRTEVASLAAAGLSFEVCEKESAAWVNQLLDQLQAILKPTESTPFTEKAATILKQALDARHFDLQQRIQKDVTISFETRQAGVFFTTEAGERCYLETEDLETLMQCLNKAMSATQGMLLNTIAADLANAKGEHVTCRTQAIVRLKEGMTPLIEAQHTLRELLVGNALARIRDGMGYIRMVCPSAHTKASWNTLCTRAERALSEMRGKNVEDVQKRFNQILRAIRDEVQVRSEAGTLNLDKDIDLLEQNLSDDLNTVHTFGERDEPYGNRILRDGVKLLDALSLTFKRTTDLQDLIFNSLEILPKNLAKLEALQRSGTLTSKWMKINAGSLRTLADQLRTDFAIYTKKVFNYANILREEGAWNVDSERRQAAVDDVKDALSICTASFMPMIRMVSELEIYAREAFLYYDVEVSKEKYQQAPKPEAEVNAQAPEGVQAATAPAVEKAPTAKTPRLCVDLELAETARDLHIALQNAFCALSEIPRGLLLAHGQTAEKDGLQLLKMVEQGEVSLSMMSGVDAKRNRERSSIPFIGHNVFANLRKAHADKEDRVVTVARAIYQKGFDGNALSMRLTMVRHGGRSADLFNATENVALSLAAEKRRGLLSPAVVKALEELVDARIRMRDVATLHQRLKAKLPEIAQTDLAHLDTNGGASDLVMKLFTLSSKWEAYSILDQGASKREYYAGELNRQIKDYQVLSLNDNQGKVDRVLLADAEGNKCFYTLKTEEKRFGKHVVFTPERGAATTFKAFSLAAKHFPLPLP